MIHSMITTYMNAWKMFLLLGSLVCSFFIVGTASAQMTGMMYGRGTVFADSGQNASGELAAILSEQGARDRSEIDCGNISDEQFEALGDAFMEDAHPGEQHEAMDRMMGGEGSETLRLAHVNMGRAYLGCWAGYSGGILSMPMMGGAGYASFTVPQSARPWGMMQGMNTGFGGMRIGFPWAVWITIVLLWILMFESILILGRKILSKKDRRDRS